MRERLRFWNNYSLFVCNRVRLCRPGYPCLASVFHLSSVGITVGSHWCLTKYVFTCRKIIRNPQSHTFIQRVKITENAVLNTVRITERRVLLLQATNCTHKTGFTVDSKKYLRWYSLLNFALYFCITQWNMFFCGCSPTWPQLRLALNWFSCFHHPNAETQDALKQELCDKFRISKPKTLKTYYLTLKCNKVYFRDYFFKCFIYIMKVPNSPSFRVFMAWLTTWIFS